MNKLFFSHSLTTYNTILEDKCLGYLREHYPEYEIVNPNSLDLPDDFDAAMQIVLPLLRNCDLLAYYKDDSYSPGVDMEIAEANRFGISVHKIDGDKLFRTSHGRFIADGDKQVIVECNHCRHTRMELYGIGHSVRCIQCGEYGITLKR